MPGQRWAEAIEGALAQYPLFVVVLSPSSVASANVQDEVAWALEEKKTVIPILYRDCPVPLRLRSLHFIDFRTDYTRGLATLLAGAAPKPDEPASNVPLPPTQTWRAKNARWLAVSFALLAAMSWAAFYYFRTLRPSGAQITGPPSMKTQISDVGPSPFAVGEGVILASAGTSSTWKADQHSGIGLRSLCFATPNLGWAVGNGGTILRSENGGQDWKRWASPTQNTLNAVTCPTATACWAVGERGAMINTHDGQTWNEDTSGTKNELLAITFADDKSGLAVGSLGVVRHTNDGGVTWHKQVITFLNLVSVACQSPQSCWILGVWGGIWHSTDGGQNWGPEPPHPGLASLTHYSSLSLCAVGGQIACSYNGGWNWSKPKSSDQDNIQLHSIAFSDADSGWAVGDKGLILHTADGGRTWTREVSGVQTNLLAVAVRPAQPSQDTQNK